jgi:hypothetical protein
MDINLIIEELENEILWRYKELKNIKKLYFNNITKNAIKIGSSKKIKINNTPESKYILRSSIPLIYAHWEGYFKKAIQVLNKELDSSIVDFNNLNTMLLSILSRDKHNKKYVSHQLRFSEIILDTESNLNWDVLEKFLYRYNLRIKEFEKYSPKINQLVKIRNGISHGENAYHFDDFSQIEEYIQLVIRLMIITKQSLINCIIYKSYYKD